MPVIEAIVYVDLLTCLNLLATFYKHLLLILEAQLGIRLEAIVGRELLGLLPLLIINRIKTATVESNNIVYPRSRSSTNYTYVIIDL
jgi:hypothetical protein